MTTIGNQLEPDAPSIKQCVLNPNSNSLSLLVPLSSERQGKMQEEEKHITHILGLNTSPYLGPPRLLTWPTGVVSQSSTAQLPLLQVEHRGDGST